MSTEKLVLPSESYAIRGACFEVYNQKGCGFLESVYQECLELEFALVGIPFVSQPKLEVHYKGHKLEGQFQPDFICHGKVIVEIKAVTELTDEHRAQVHNYLRASAMKLALLVNFGAPNKDQIERIVL